MFFIIFYHFFIIFVNIFLTFFYHFFFQWCKHFPKNGKLQFSSSFFHFFIMFLSFLLPVVELIKKMIKNDETW